MQSYSECIYRHNDEAYFLSLDYLFKLKIEMLYFFQKTKNVFIFQWVLKHVVIWCTNKNDNWCITYSKSKRMVCEINYEHYTKHYQDVEKLHMLSNMQVIKQS